MQNLPIPSAPPATQAQVAPSADVNATPAAEPFGNVLARQRANSNDSNTEAQGGGQPAASSTDSATVIAVASEKLIELPVPETDVAGTLPGDMLAVLPPFASSASKTAVSKEKTGLQEHTPSGDALVALSPALVALPPIAAALSPIAAASVALPSTPAMRHGADAAIQPQPMATGIFDGARQSAGVHELPSLLHAQGNAMPVAVAGANTPKDNNFSAIMEISSKSAANTMPLNSDAAPVSTQTVQPDPAALASQMQASAAPVAASLNVTAQAVINTPVTRDTWGDEFNQKITWLATQHEQSAELHLNPPHLGPLDVVLKVSGDQATAMFTSPHAAVRDAVEQAMPRLREMLADNGIMLGNATVSDQSPREQQAGLADKPHKGGERLSRRGTDAAIGIQISGAIGTTRRHQGMVDTFV